ncbi:MAG: hypothetical protein IPM84_09310 [Anaerolineae bacterium]|nr:hypothetical protein [Anaerolineae bacterium]
MKRPVGIASSLPNGAYTVVLRFAEFNVANASARVMRIEMEGATVEAALSIYGSAGRYTALDKVYQAVVNDGELNILFAANGGSYDPIINAIEVSFAGARFPTPTPTTTAPPYVQRVNSGGPSFTDGQGVVWRPMRRMWPAPGATSAARPNPPPWLWPAPWTTRSTSGGATIRWSIVLPCPMALTT